MLSEPTLVNSSYALIGAMMGGGASLAAAIYTQRHQDHWQGKAREIAKREAVYAEFIMTASKGLVQAYISDGLSWSADEQHLFALVNRMRLFATADVMHEAEAVVRKIIDISEQPKLAVSELTRTTFKERLAPDLLFEFSLVSQADLKRVSAGSGYARLHQIGRILQCESRGLREMLRHMVLAAWRAGHLAVPKRPQTRW